MPKEDLKTRLEIAKTKFTKKNLIKNEEATSSIGTAFKLSTELEHAHREGVSGYQMLYTPPPHVPRMSTHSSPRSSGVDRNMNMGGNGFTDEQLKLFFAWRLAGVRSVVNC